jgi:tetratricopeptide (TPR) repeat protein
VALEAQAPGPGLYWLDLGVPEVERPVRALLRLVGASFAPGGSPFEIPGPGPGAGEETPHPALEEAEQTAGAFAPAEMARRYLEAVTAYADGDLAGALDVLAHLEAAVVVGSGSDLKELRRAQRQVIDELVAGGAGLLPLIDLHARLDAGYLAAEQARLAAHNRVFVVELAERWVKVEGTAEARQLGGLLLATLGAVPQALELDPSNTLAMLRLAIAAERSGQLQTAADYLQRLLELATSDAHARIRLAVVARRMGQADQARALLSGLIAPAGSDRPPSPRWIVALAFQELAMLEREAGRLDAADAVLLRGIDETGTQSLHLQRAYYLDRQLRFGQSVAALDPLVVDGAAADASPRHRYSGQPEAELAAARERIASAVEDRVDGLRVAVRRSAGEPARSP